MSRPLIILILASALFVLAAVVFLLRHAPVTTPPPEPVLPANPPVPGRATLGAHTLVGQEDRRAAAVARTGSMLTEASGSSFVAFAAGFASNSAGPVDNLGNEWRLFGEPVVYAGYADRFDVRAYLVLNGNGGPDHRVWIEKPGKPRGELTLPVVEIRNASRLVDAAQNYAPKGSRLTSGTVTTPGPAILIAFWWGDGGGLRHSAEPDNGFEVIERFTELPPKSAVQCVVAVREVDRAGSYHVTWSTTPEQGAPLWLFAFASQTGGAGQGTPNSTGTGTGSSAGAPR